MILMGVVTLSLTQKVLQKLYVLGFPDFRPETMR
jgi:hypothetical protein